MFKKFEYDKLSSFLVGEALQNYPLVKHYNAEKIELAKYATVIDKYSKYFISSMKSLQDLNLGQRIIFSAAMITNLILAVIQVKAGIFTPGDVVMIQALLA